MTTSCVPRLVRSLLADLEAQSRGKPRLYGMELEFLARRVLTRDDLDGVRGLLASRGFVPRGDELHDASGLFVSFEPGGQLEFGIPPLRADDRAGLVALVERMRAEIAAIARERGIVYEGRSYAPGRIDAPMLLDKPRYRDMHRHFGVVGTRGREMMKASASVHLHVGFGSPEEMVRLFARMAELSRDGRFAMGAERRDIWRHTDPSRCGLIEPASPDSEALLPFLNRLVEFTLDTAEFATGRPLRERGEVDDATFRHQLTTLFTDVRLNLKGPTVELRTPDAHDLDDVPALWSAFVAEMERVPTTRAA